jgi:hypothetical protein
MLGVKQRVPMKTRQNRGSRRCGVISGLTCLLTIASIPAASQETSNQNVEILDIVWNTVNQRYFDPDFGGIDWSKQYQRYKPKIASCDSSDCLYDNLNRMLFELGVSHLGVASESIWSQPNGPIEGRSSSCWTS